MFVKETLQPVTLLDTQLKYAEEGVEVSIVRITLKKPVKNVILVAVYRPPNAKVTWFDKLNELLLEILVIAPLILLGDLNSDLLTPACGPAKLLLSSLALAGLKVPELFATRICATSSTCLDIIAFPANLKCDNYSIVNSTTSDHFPVTAVISATHASQLKPVRKRSFKRVDMSELKIRAANISLDTRTLTTPDELLDSWQSSMTAILDEVAPVKNYPLCKKQCKWITSDVRGLMLRRDALARKIIHDKSQVLIEELKLRKRQVKSRIRRATRVHGTRVLEEDSLSDAWKFIREISFTTPKGEKTSMDLTILNDHLAKTVQKSDDNVLQLPVGCDGQLSFNIIPLDCTETARMLNTLRIRTATGPDQLPAFILNKLALELAPNLTVILNSSIESGVFPLEWKRANVSAIWKNKGSKTDPANYRPISILPVLGRMFEKAIARQLSHYCNVHNLIPVEQFGFRAKSSCELALLTALDSWMKEVDQSKVVGALLIDLSRAFDTVPHQRLLTDLAEIGCSQLAIEWFRSYLSGRKQRVTQGDQVTQWMDVSRGVPQGSCLSPLLFNIFVRDIPRKVQSDSTQFADDITLSEADRDVSNVVKRLTDSFTRTKEFCIDRDLIINTAKTQFVLFKQPAKKVSDDLAIILDGCSIKPTEHVMLLGVTLDRHLTFSKHMDITVEKCNATIGVLARAAPYLPRELLRMAYIALIRSHLEYASATFAAASPSQLKRLDIVQKVAARVVCRAPRIAHSAPLLESLRLESLGSRRRAHVTSVVERIVSGDSHPALLNMFWKTPQGTITNNEEGRTIIGKRRFSVFAKDMITAN